MYVQGVSTRKGKAVTEALCGHSFSESSISAIINKSLDESLRAFSRDGFLTPILISFSAPAMSASARGVIGSQAVLIAVAVDLEGRRQILAVELANRESRWSWRDFLLGLRKFGLSGVEFVVSDDTQASKPRSGKLCRKRCGSVGWRRRVRLE